MFTQEYRQGHRSSKQSRILSVKRNIFSDMSTNVTERVIKLISLEYQLISVVEDQGFLCHLEFLNPRYALPSLHYIDSTFELQHAGTSALVSWVSYSRACKTGNLGDAECVWHRQAVCPHYFMWQHKVYEKSKGWYGGTKHGLHLTHFSWLNTRVCCHSAASQTHLLTQGRWRPML